MTKRRKSYSDEFKRDAVRLLKQSGKSAQQREVEILRQERDILKKAVTIFS